MLITLNVAANKMKSDRKIIVIEDDRDISELIAYNLHKHGYSCEQIFNGLEAVEELKRKPFEIIILDLMLPGLDGFDICRELQSEGDNQRRFIIVVSARNSAEDKMYANMLGASMYLTKPFSVAQLISAVDEIDSILDREYVVKAK